jgi:rare lipoprotein A
VRSSRAGGGAGLALIVAVALAGAACTSARRPTPAAAVERERGEVELGKASWYGPRFHGRKTASGERFDRHAMTAAHKRLRFGTRVRVTNLGNGQSVIVRINDRGPYARGRIIDLAEAAARRIGMIEAGVIKVELEILSTPPPRHR